MSKTCAWCGQPAAAEIEVEPTRTRVRRMVDPQTGEAVSVTEVTQLAIKTWACVAHLSTVQNQPPPVRTPSRTKAKGVEQLSILDVPGVGPASAVFGDAA